MTKPLSKMSRSELVDACIKEQQRSAALAAHVERLFEVWDTLTSEDRPDVPTLIQHMDDVFTDGPATSLARRDLIKRAEAQIEAFEGVLAYCKAVPPAASSGRKVLRILRERAEARRSALRRQAEEGEP